jgi:hypothetical protein
VVRSAVAKDARICETPRASGPTPKQPTTDVHLAAFSKRKALLAMLAASGFAVILAPAAANANLLDDFNNSQLQSKSKLFMGPVALTFERLVALQTDEREMDVSTLADALGAATLDCLNPRGVLAAYATVRDVCTLGILVKSATKGPACVNAKDSQESINVNAALGELKGSYETLAKSLSDASTVGPERDAAFATCKQNLRNFAQKLLNCFPIDETAASETKSVFPDLFA